MRSDAEYHPVLFDARSVLSATTPVRLLVVGDAVPDGFEFAASVRMVRSPDATLPVGVYSFRLEDGIAVMVVSIGSDPGDPLEADWDETEADPLVQAYGWFESWWDGASDVPPPLFAIGGTVTTRGTGREGTVRSRDLDDGAWWYEIRLERTTHTFRETDLQAPVIDDDPAAWADRPAAPPDRFAATLTRAKLREHLADTVYSFRATRTLFRAYQFRPVMRLLESGRLRLLIADEVGLGKTIEAGLVWTELDARRQAGRVLVVCPSMLVPKWRAEMRERFGYELDELDRSGLEDLLERAEQDRLPGRHHWICSLERLRVWNGLERLAELAPRFDLIVVDEAHALRNAGTRSHALGVLLSDWADALVLLSATPLNLGNDDLYNLLEILAPGEFDDRLVLEERLEPNAVLNRVGRTLLDRTVGNEVRLVELAALGQLTFGPAVTERPEYRELERLLSSGPDLDPAGVVEARRLISRLHALSAVVTRTRKSEVHERSAVREVASLPVEWTPAEAELYVAIERWQRQRARAQELPVGFVTQMPLRLASSCLPAARDLILSTGGVDATDDDLDGGTEPWTPLTDSPPPEVVELAGRLGDVDTKFDVFRERLEQIIGLGRQVLVFTFSRRTLAHLARRLRDEGFRARVLHGDIDRDDRHRIIAEFRSGGFDVLIASRVASEGLDFEFASAVVNYDLPWNPMEVEQRIGRVDRFGQEEEVVHVINFHTPGTIESDIIERVLQRIGVFKDSIGDLEPIIQSRMSDLRRAMFSFELDDDQRRRAVEQQLAAIEEQVRVRDEVETAAAYLSSTDEAEIAGLEDELEHSGRYIGQGELVLLLRDWVAHSPGSSFQVDERGEWAYLSGSAALEEHLQAVRAAGERSEAELAKLARSLRDEVEIRLCLDQEVARRSGAELLGATHPLVRAALRVPGSDQARSGSVSFRSAVAPSGSYVVLVSVAHWSGVRSRSELWTAAVTPDGAAAPGSVGDGLLAALARAELAPGPTTDGVAVAPVLPALLRQTRRRLAEESDRRLAENRALVTTRSISLRETHARKIEQIERRIATLRSNGRDDVIRLHEGQRAAQDRLLERAEAALDATSVGELTVEHVAIAIVEVRP